MRREEGTVKRRLKVERAHGEKEYDGKYGKDRSDNNRMQKRNDREIKEIVVWSLFNRGWSKFNKVYKKWRRKNRLRSMQKQEGWRGCIRERGKFS